MRLVLQGDNLTGLKYMLSHSIHPSTFVIDPPYNTSTNRIYYRKNITPLNQNKGDWDFFESHRSFLFHLYRRLYLIDKIIENNGSIYIFTPDYYISYILHFLERMGWKYKNTLVWIKSNPVPRFSKTGYILSQEFALFATKGTANYFKWQKFSDMLSYTKLPIVSGKERIKTPKYEDGKTKWLSSHATQKPIELIKKFISISNPPGGIVSDVYAGSGTTLCAAEELGAPWIGCEIEESYIDIIKYRFGNPTEKIYKGTQFNNIDIEIKKL